LTRGKNADQKEEAVPSETAGRRRYELLTGKPWKNARGKIISIEEKTSFFIKKGVGRGGNVKGPRESSISFQGLTTGS